MELKVTKLSDFLNEALPLSLAKQYNKIDRNEVADSILKKAFSKYGKERVYLDLPKDVVEKFADDIVKECGSYFPIFRFLDKKGITIIDFVNNVAKEPRQSNTTKITKILAKNDENALLDMYIKDYLRIDLTKNKSASYKVVISKAKYDVAGMSSDRYWTSCMTLDLEDGNELGLSSEAGSNAHYVPVDIKAGTIIAYLIANNDININNPFGRVLIKPYINPKDYSKMIWVPESICYGNILKNGGDFTDEFLDIVSDWVDDNINSISKDENATYIKAASVYTDDHRDKAVYKDGKLVTTFNHENVELTCVYGSPNIVVKIGDAPKPLSRILDTNIVSYKDLDLTGIEIDPKGNSSDIDIEYLGKKISKYLNDLNFYEKLTSYLLDNEFTEEEQEDVVFKVVSEKYKNMIRQIKKEDSKYIVELINIILDKAEVRPKGVVAWKDSNMIVPDGGNLMGYLMMDRQDAVELGLNDFYKVENYSMYQVIVKTIINSGYSKYVLPYTKMYKEQLNILSNDKNLYVQNYIIGGNVKITLELVNRMTRDDKTHPTCPTVRMENYHSHTIYRYVIKEVKGTRIHKMEKL